MATIIEIGLFAGFLIGSIGVGGVIVVPALAYLVDIDIRRAIAVALMGYVLSGVVGTLRYARKGSIRWRTARILVVAAAPATIAGAFMTHEISPVLLKILVGVVWCCRLASSSYLSNRFVRPRLQPRSRLGVLRRLAPSRD